MDVIYLMNNLEAEAKKGRDYLDKLQRLRTKANKNRKAHYQRLIDDYFQNGIPEGV